MEGILAIFISYSEKIPKVVANFQQSDNQEYLGRQANGSMGLLMERLLRKKPTISSGTSTTST